MHRVATCACIFLIVALATSLGEAQSCFPHWESQQGGVSGGPQPGVTSIALFDEGPGAALYVSGTFLAAGGVPTDGFAKWDGAKWSLGPGLAQGTFLVAVVDDGTGPALYGASSAVARWTGTKWIAVGGAIGAVRGLVGFDDGTGPALYAAGDLPMYGHVARWDSKSGMWSGVGGGVSGADGKWFTNPEVRTLAVLSDGPLRGVYVAGHFLMAGATPVHHIARWDGAACRRCLRRR